MKNQKGYKSNTLDLSNRDIRLKKILRKLSAEDGIYICRLLYSDPLIGIYGILLTVYVFILIGFLLWPFDLAFYIKNDARWITGPNGIEFLKSGQAVSRSSNPEFFDRLINGTGLTIEVWLETKDLDQFGPVRILSYSINPYLRNFTLGQSQDQLIIRLRTTETSLNGMNPHLIIEEAFDDQSPQHIVVTYDFSEQNVYINGERRAQSRALKGDFTNWDPSGRLVIGNEVTGRRPWKGKIFYAAVFDRPLKEKEILKKYLVGIPSETTNGNSKSSAFKTISPLAEYLFEHGKGDVIYDSGSCKSPLNLFMPRYIQQEKRLFLDFSKEYFQYRSSFTDVTINILIFIPFGILIHGMLRTRYGLTLKISFAAFFAGTLFTLGIEVLQYFSVVRNSSLIDVVVNMTGNALGIATDWAYSLFLNRRAAQLQTRLCDRKA